METSSRHHSYPHVLTCQSQDAERVIRHRALRLARAQPRSCVIQRPALALAGQQCGRVSAELVSMGSMHAAGCARRRSRRRLHPRAALTIVQTVTLASSVALSAARCSRSSPARGGGSGAFLAKNQMLCRSSVSALVRATDPQDRPCTGSSSCGGCARQGITDLATIQKALTSPARVVADRTRDIAPPRDADLSGLDWHARQKCLSRACIEPRSSSAPAPADMHYGTD
jgi:hypothetical protein